MLQVTESQGANGDDAVPVGGSALGRSGRLRGLQARLGKLTFRDAFDRSNATRWVRSALILGGAFLAGLAQYPVPIGSEDSTSRSVASEVDADPIKVPSVPVGAEGSGKSDDEVLKSGKRRYSVRQMPWASVVGWLGVMLTFAGGIWSLLAERTAPVALSLATKAVNSAQDAEIEAVTLQIALEREQENAAARLAELESDVEWTETLCTLVDPLLRNVVLRLLTASAPMRTEDLQDVLHQVARHINFLVGYEGGEYWTLSIYRWSADDGRLHCEATVRADRAREGGERRSWGGGEGVVGQAFSTNREIVVEDLHNPIVKTWHHVPKALARDDDLDFYRSAAAVPIRLDEEQPWGIFVATSDRPDRFSFSEGTEASREIAAIRAFARMIALATIPLYMRVNQGNPADAAAQGNSPEPTQNYGPGGVEAPT